ncbi:uncharacterized protein LOC124847175 [Vigna umbellata]|uniref:uncharacterized protein LOC124846179 n=1 Tax=Vigna umbellata TaxID=87088 RepID=UPI001F5E421C|nr:uncharacterized protein LOC124846179 [Vigna umbellata]XP_047180554.1 uncharacterized protein LOC124847175 [Vigna umbellata]
MFDDFLQQLCNEDDIFPLGEDVFDGLLQPNNESNPLDDVLLGVLKEMEEGELREMVADTPSHSVTKDATPTVPFASENCSNSSFSFPQSNPNAWNQPSGMNNTTVGFGNMMFPDTAGNSMNQFQSPSFPMLTCGSSSSSIHQPFPKPLQFQAIGITIRGTPAMKHRFNQGLVSPPPPSLTDFHSFVCAWQGCLIGKIYSNRESLNVAKAVRKPTSPVTLAADWRSTLRIVSFLPTKTVNYTLK